MGGSGRLPGIGAGAGPEKVRKEWVLVLRSSMCEGLVVRGLSTFRKLRVDSWEHWVECEVRAGLARLVKGSLREISWSQSKSTRPCLPWQGVALCAEDLGRNCYVSRREVIQGWSWVPQILTWPFPPTALSDPCRLHFPDPSICWLLAGFSEREVLLGNWMVVGRQKSGCFSPTLSTLGSITGCNSICPVASPLFAQAGCSSHLLWVTPDSGVQ